MVEMTQVEPLHDVAESLSDPEALKGAIGR